MPSDFLYGVLNLSFWGYVIVTLCMVQITIMAVTLYLHRDQAHRSVTLHPALRHFFRFWIWLTSGMLTREWVAVHRKHHAWVDREGDPHSPRVVGLKKVLLEGAELYRAEAEKPQTLAQYGRGCPDDWVEREVYSRYPHLGIVSLAVADLVLFGIPGITIFAIQMLAMPVLAAGVINGFGHAVGYRNFESRDTSTNIVPWGLVVGGEELHNNHHAFPSSAKFSVQPWEFDIGWLWIRLFQALGLARVRRVAPKRPRVQAAPTRQIDAETLRTVLVHRMHVLRDYTRYVTAPVLRAELQRNRDALQLRMRRLLKRQPALLDDATRARVNSVVANLPTLASVLEYRERLRALWEQAGRNEEKLVRQLREWVHEAESSGIQALQDFAARLRGYVGAQDSTTLRA